MDFVYQLFMSCDTGTKWSKKKFRSVIRIHKCAADVDLLYRVLCLRNTHNRKRCSTQGASDRITCDWEKKEKNTAVVKPLTRLRARTST